MSNPDRNSDAMTDRIHWEINFPPAPPMSWLIDREGRRSDDPVRVPGEESA
jgi:hypothetical protein